MKPTLVAEVEFADWTPESQVRHAKYLGLRIDKDAKSVKRESAVMPQGPALLKAGSSVVDGMKVSHPERVIDASTGITKLELVRYCGSVAEWMLPHLQGPRLRRMVPIAGEPPGAGAPLQGCRFAPRCAHAVALCEHEYPPQLRYDNGDEVACWLHVPGADLGRSRAAPQAAVIVEELGAESAAAPHNEPPLLELRGLTLSFPSRRSAPPVHAVADVSLAVHAGESVGLAGESGSGKTTLAWMILQLLAPTHGAIFFDGQPVTMASRTALAAYRRSVQAVLQDSSAALNGRMRIRDLVAEPLVVQQPGVTARAIDERVDELLHSVGLAASTKSQFPHELSGGQKQRVAIARALVNNPRLLVLDEPVSALDVSVRSQVLNLLLDLKAARKLSFLIVAHDLAVLRHVTDTLVVMYHGRVVEQGPTEHVLAHPAHPYTRALVAASPRLDGVGRVAIVDRETGAAPLAGCAFAPRCPQAVALCLASRPALVALGGAAGDAHLHSAACHFSGGATTG